MMQHILEHGSKDQKCELASSLLGCLDKKMCSNEKGVAVLSAALKHAPEEHKRALADALLQDKDRFIRLASQRHGEEAIATLLSGPDGKKVRVMLAKQKEHLKG